MIKTFIYGTPLGFDLYEKSVEYLDFFKGFYISSRKGRRLMVNRKSNGETTYNYLRYGLQEAAGRPNSFFGMTIMIDSDQYCPNFKVILEWFDYLFGKLVNERQLFRKNENGTLQYQVEKFGDNTTDVEWLKSNLPNILTQAQQTQLLEYDDSFADGKAGQIVSFPHDVNEASALKKFKKNRWISFSGKIIDDVIIEESAEIELDYIELEKKLNEFSQTLLPIAVDISKGTTTELKGMNDEVNEISSNIATYLKKVSDKNLFTSFTELEGKYFDLKQSLKALLDKMTVSKPILGPIPEPKPEPETQFCFTCKLNKPSSAFRSKEATKCIACEEHDKAVNPPQTKLCVKCGDSKPLDQFSKKHPSICIECDSQQNPPKTPKTPKTPLLRVWPHGAIICILLLAGASAGIWKHYAKEEQKQNTEAVTNQPKDSTKTDAIDPEKLDGLIEKEDFLGIYNCINGKADIPQYAPKVKDAVEKHLFGILETQTGTESRKVGIQEFYINNQRLLDLIGFNEQNKLEWDDIQRDYEMLVNLIQKKQLTQREKDFGKEALQRHVGLFPSEWLTTVNNKPLAKASTQETPKEQNVKEGQQKKPLPTNANPSVTFTKASDGQQGTKAYTPNRSKSFGVDAKVGTTATVTKTDGSTLTITVKKGENRVQCGDGIMLTITGKSQVTTV